jgi:hypothetical protein
LCTDAIGAVAWVGGAGHTVRDGVRTRRSVFWNGNIVESSIAKTSCAPAMTRGSH